MVFFFVNELRSSIEDKSKFPRLITGLENNFATPNLLKAIEPLLVERIYTSVNAISGMIFYFACLLEYFLQSNRQTTLTVNDVSCFLNKCFKI